MSFIDDDDIPAGILQMGAVFHIPLDRIDGDDGLVKIVEKPKLEDVKSNLVHVSKFIMSPALLQEMVKYVKTHDFGPMDQEYMATDPLDAYVKKGGVVRVAPTNGEYLDGGSVEGWLHANNVVCG